MSEQNIWTWQWIGDKEPFPSDIFIYHWYCTFNVFDETFKFIKTKSHEHLDFSSLDDVNHDIEYFYK